MSLDQRDKIFDDQLKIGEEIKTFFVNYGKRSTADRSNLAFITKQLNKVIDLYKEFQTNNNALDNLESQDESYFVENYYENIKEIYTKGIAKIMAEKKKIEDAIPSLNPLNLSEKPMEDPPTLNQQNRSEKPPESENNEGEGTSVLPTAPAPPIRWSEYPLDEDNGIFNPELLRLVKQQRSTFFMLRKKMGKANETDLSTLPSERIQLVINGLSNLWDQAVEGNQKIFSLADDLNDKLPLDYSMEVYSNFEDDVEKVIARLIAANEAGRSELHRDQNTSQFFSTPNSSMHRIAHLPKISIDPFDGDPLKWNGFKKLFEDMIDRESISDSQKLWYLRNALCGEAGGMVTIIDLNLESYKDAWERVKNKYDNPRFLASAVADKLFSQRSFKEEDALGIRKLRDCTQECLATLKSLGIVIDNCEFLIVFLLMKKLDNQSRKDFEKFLPNVKEIPNLKIFYEFLEKQSQILEGVCSQSKSNRARVVNTASTGAQHQYYKGTKNESQSDSKCVCCKESNHKLTECFKFISFNRKARWICIKRNNVCCKCLVKGHLASSCDKPKCQMCGKNHHKMLHDDQSGYSASGQGAKGYESQEVGKVVLSLSNSINCSTLQDHDAFVFLGTAIINIIDNKGQKIKCRAILDSGSQVNLLTRSMSKRLGLPRIQKLTNILGVGESEPSISRESVSLQICSINEAFKKTVSALIFPNLTRYLPSEKVDFISKDTVLADPEFYKPNRIDLLLGASIFPLLLLNNIVELGDGLPQLVETVFGWVIMGALSSENASQSVTCGITSEEVEFQLNAPKLWDIEEQDESVLSVEEDLAIKVFQETTRRNEQGRFVVKLPKSKDPALLGDSYSIALKRFQSLERRFAKNSTLFTKYYDFLNEYLQMGHMEKIDLDNTNLKHRYFIPHHSIVKLESSTTKLRVVFDGSCRTSTDYSLNDILLKGPVVQCELFDLLIRFRFPRYTMSADIEKMFRQVLVDEEDCNLQLILWRNQPSLPISCYRLKTITYGTTPAPFLSTQCLQSLSSEYATKFPLSSKILGEDFYVDDLITGVDNLELALQVQRELVMMLSSAGFHLRKWCSNHELLLKEVPDVDKEIQWSPKSGTEFVKTLGVIWTPMEDCFKLKVSASSNSTLLTKRTISSESGSIFDPLGFVSPFVLIAKLVIQELWVHKMDWDTEVPSSIASKWSDFRRQLENLKNFSIPRHVICLEPKRIEIHGFCDASLKAYGAVVYIRSMSSKNDVQTSLLCSKSKVAPIGTTTIPKLELSGARLLVELVAKIKDCIRYKVDDVYFWCDSKVALCWISKDPGSFKPYVSNRVKAIQGLSNKKQWHHIAGDQNPADIISRGMFVDDLMKSQLWFNGPDFLKTERQNWPCEEFESAVESSEVCSELKKVVVNMSVVEFDKSNFLEFNHRNSFRTLQRVVGFVLRFVKICKSKTQCRKLLKGKYEELKGLDMISLRAYVLRNAQNLSVDDLEDSIKFVVRYLQNEFGLEKEIKGSFKSLIPFKDPENIIRVGGRLRNSRLPFDAKHQMLLPKCKVTKLLIIQIHLDNYHAGPNALLSLVRQRFWPIDGKRLCSQVFHRCVSCFKCKPHDLVQLMGDLPCARVNLAAPFEHTGIDYAGPFYVHYKIRGKRPTKVYLAVFVCFATKGVHLEIVSDLTTEAFLLCLKRFVSRRGKPAEIWSDNATNFVGAKQELKELNTFLEKHNAEISGWTANKGVKWLTIPARSPHFGGLWEAAVKRAKFHLQHIVQFANLTFEELNTVVIEVESILNSRPLCPISENPNDFDALTPNHFLVSGNVEVIPDKDFSNCKGSLLKKYNLVCKLRADLWADFQKFYLHNLQERKKWSKVMSNVEEDSLVLIKNKNAIVNSWEMGRIIKAIPGEDGLVRVVELKTPKGIKRRAVCEIAPLPLATDYDEPSLSKMLEKIEEKKSPSPSTTKKPNLTSNILSSMFIFLLIFPLILGRQVSVNVTQFKNHPGLYFDGVGKINIINDKWHLVTYFNLTNYWSQCGDLAFLIKRTKGLCNENLCLRTIEHLEDRMMKIQQLNMLIQEECHMREIVRTHSIGKRSYGAPLNVIGNIARSLFGTLDNEYAEKMETTLSNVKSNEDRLLLLIKNHTTVIDQTVNIMKKNNQEVTDQFNKLHNETITLAATQKRDSKRILFNTLVNYVKIVMTEYRETQLELHSVMKDFKKGKLNALLVTPEELEHHIKEMEHVLGSSYNIPSTHFAELETISQVAVTHGRSCLMFQIEIPLLRREPFDLYRMIPIPTFLKGKAQFIRPIDNFLAINMRSQLYYLLGVEEYEKCEQFYNLKLCYQEQVMYPTKGDSHCEVNLFLGSKVITPNCDLRYGMQDEYWISLYTTNHWLFALKNEVEVNVMCDQNSNLLETVRLKGEGIIEVPPTCSLDANGVTIPGRSVIESSLFLKKIPSVLPEVNLTTSAVHNYSIKPLIVKLDNLDAISNSIAVAKNEEAVNLKPVLFDDAPDIYHVVSFACSGLLLIAGIIVCAYLIRCKTQRQDQLPNNVTIKTELPRLRSRFAITDAETINL